MSLHYDDFVLNAERGLDGFISLWRLFHKRTALNEMWFQKDHTDLNTKELKNVCVCETEETLVTMTEDTFYLQDSQEKE